MYLARQKQRPIHPRKSPSVQGEIDQLRKASFIYQIAYTLGYIIQACPRLEELPVFQAQVKRFSHNNMVCSDDRRICIFKGFLDNVAMLMQRYGLNKTTNEVAIVI